MSDKQPEGGKGKRWSLGELLYGALSILFMVAVGVLVFLVGEAKPYLAAGVMIGAIYVLVALYYFYEQFLVPYLKEKNQGSPNIESGYIYSPNIYAWIAQWCFPALALQAFVVLGFYVTIARFPLQGNIYTAPYHYGLIYKRFQEYLPTIQPPRPDISTMTEEGKAKREEIEKFLMANFAQYLKTESDKLKAHGETNTEAETQTPGVSKGIERGAHLEEIERKIQVIPFMIAVAFGFLGSLIYTLKDTAYRFYTLDLYPKTYVSYIIRFLFAPSLCIVIAYFLMNDWPVNSTPILFFLVGFFPQTALQYIEEKARQILKLRKEEKGGISLEMIQGVTDYTLYRLRELGIDDVQNLANVDLTYLRRNMGSSNRFLADLVSQALLILHFKENLDKLHSFGIRDLLSFQECVTNDNYENISKVTGIPPEKLAGFLSLLKSDAMKERVKTLAHLKCETDKKERDQLSREIKCR